MSTKQERVAREEKNEEASRLDARQQQECGHREAMVLKAVLRGLGCPTDFLRGSVRQLWDNHYRVNIFVGPDIASARVAHSFFLEADTNGLILTSSPPVTKAY